jgi:hypothetical protein
MLYGYIYQTGCFFPVRWYFSFINWLESLLFSYIPIIFLLIPERRERLLTNRLTGENFIVIDSLSMLWAEKKSYFFIFSCFVYNVRVSGTNLVCKTKHTVYIVNSHSCVCMHLWAEFKVRSRLFVCSNSRYENTGTPACARGQ